jgi:hypothetical protein
MQITGAQWSFEGAEAILRLRSLRASGDLDDYWQHHEQRELERNHAPQYANWKIPSLTWPAVPSPRRAKPFSAARGEMIATITPLWRLRKRAAPI